MEMDEGMVMDAPESMEEFMSQDRGRGGLSRSGKSRVRRTSLSLLEPEYYRSPTFSDQGLPAVVAGGLDYVYACPTRTGIPSTGEQLRVPLSVDAYPVDTFYRATPSLMKTAFLKAEVSNRGERPILAGLVNIFVGKDFVGQGRLKTTGPGGKLDLPLGADEDIRLKRTVVPSTETEGLISKDEVTTYATTIEIGNYKKRPIGIEIIDQVPKSGREDIEIKLGPASPKPTSDPDEDGIMRWRIDIPAGQMQKIEFSYEIRRPENWKLYQ